MISFFKKLGPHWGHDGPTSLSLDIMNTSKTSARFKVTLGKLRQPLQEEAQANEASLNSWIIRILREYVKNKKEKVNGDNKR